MNGDYVVQGPAGTAPTFSGPRLRVGIIGLGIGRMHIEGWQQHPQVRGGARRGSLGGPHLE